MSGWCSWAEREREGEVQGRGEGSKMEEGKRVEREGEGKRRKKRTRIRIRKQRREREHDLEHRERGGPVVLQDVDADVAALGDVHVVDPVTDKASMREHKFWSIVPWSWSWMEEGGRRTYRVTNNTFGAENLQHQSL